MKDQYEWFYRYAGQAMAALITQRGQGSGAPKDAANTAKEAADYAGALVHELTAREDPKHSFSYGLAQPKPEKK